MIYRLATIEDVDREDFRALALEGLARGAGGLTVVPEKLWAFARQAVSDHYFALAERDGVIRAYIGAQFTPHPWLMGSMFNVGAWYSTAPGAGMGLLIRAIAWAREQGFTTLMVTLDEEGAERIVRLLERRMKVRVVRSAFAQL